MQNIVILLAQIAGIVVMVCLSVGLIVAVSAMVSVMAFIFLEHLVKIRKLFKGS